MRVLWINHRDPRHPQAGGAEVRLYEIARRLVKMGHEVTVISEKVDGLPIEDDIEGVRVRRVGGRATIHILAPLYVKKHGHQYDVIIDDVAHAVPWYSPLVTKTPVVAQIHHIHQDVLHVELPKPLALIVGKAEETIRIYKRFIAVSPSTKRELVERFGISPGAIAVVPNGVDHEKYKPGPKDPIPTVLWVGRLKRYKNPHHVLLAFRTVKRKVPDARLVFIGAGEEEPRVRWLAKRLGLTDVYFLGKVSEEEKVKWMQRAWVLVSTSAKEGWGLTVTEAAACKTPAVAYDVPGLRDAVKHMETGILVEPGNVNKLAETVSLLLVNGKLREMLADNAYNYAQSFDWKHTAEDFLRILTILIE